MSPGAPLRHWLRNSTRAQLSWAILQGCAPWPCTLLTLLSWLGSLAGPPASLVGGSDVVSTGPLAPSPHCPCPVQPLLVVSCSALVEQLVPAKRCVKNKTSFKTEGCVSCISITNLLGGCTRLPLPQLLSHFLSGMPSLKCCEQQLSCPPLPTLCCKANKQPACQGWEAGQPAGFLQNSCVSGGGRWWNPWRAELSSHAPHKTACQLACTACVGSQEFSKTETGMNSQIISASGKGYSLSHICSALLHCSPCVSNQLLILTLFSEHIRNLWRHSLRTGCNHSSELRAF